MKSKKYCPKCGSFFISSTHIGWFKRLIPGRAVDYTCSNCQHHFSHETLTQNDEREDLREKYLNTVI